MYGSGYILGRKFFQGWVIVSVLWAFFGMLAPSLHPPSGLPAELRSPPAFFAVTLFPTVEGWHILMSIISGGRFGVHKRREAAHADSPQDTTIRGPALMEEEDKNDFGSKVDAQQIPYK